MREAVSECGYLLTVRHARKEKDGVSLFFVLWSESLSQEGHTLFILRGRDFDYSFGYYFLIFII